MATGLPKNIIAQGENAAKLQKDLIVGKQNTADTTVVGKATPLVPITTEVPIEASIADAIKNTSTPALESAVNVPTHLPAVDLKKEDFEAKYKVLQGKYDKEVPRLHQEIADQKRVSESRKGLITELKNKVETLTLQLDAFQSAATPVIVSDDQPAVLNEADFDGYGEEMKDLIAVINRLAKAPVEANTTRTDQLETAVDDIREDLAVDKNQAYLVGLNGLVKDWRNIDALPQWKTWLGTLEPLTGATYQSLIDSAASAYDVNRTALIFGQFKAAFPEYTQQIAGEAGSNAAGDTLEDVIVPDTTVSSTAPGQLEVEPVKYPTRLEFQAAARARIDGKVTDADWAAYTALFQAGIKAGKVV